MTRPLPVPCRLANFALPDIVEGRGRCRAEQGETGYRFRMEVYGNVCGFAARAAPARCGCVLTASLTEPAEGLSDEGQLRALQYLLDSVEQLMENERTHYENGLAQKENERV